MDRGAHRELKVLEAIAEDGRMTQRSLAAKLGVALGLTNLYLKRLVRKGYVKCVNAQSNRVLYLLTPKGLAEKTRLTYEFMEYSLYVYRQSRQHLKRLLEPYARRPSARITIYGTGEAAELAYLCLKEIGIEPTAVFDEQGGSTFFSIPVRPIESHVSVPFDAMIVATLQDASAIVRILEEAGIAPERLVPLRQNAEPVPAELEDAAVPGKAK